MITQKENSATGVMIKSRSDVKTTIRGKILFVTYNDENLDEGGSYVIELARAMYEDIEMLLVEKKESLSKKIEDVMAGIAFAEAGLQETAGEIAAPARGKAPADYGSRLAALVLRAGEAGVRLSAESTDRNLAPAIRRYVKEHTRVNKVVLSPAVTEGEVLTTRDLGRLVRTAARPIVTMTRQSVRNPLPLVL